MKKGLLIFFSVLAFDLITKFIIRNYLNKEIILTSFLSIANISNTGASFGILQDQNLALIFVSFMALGLLLFYHDQLPKSYSVALIFAGITGNLIDRIFTGGVTDFISFSFWPAFNIADSALTIGVVWLCIELIRKK